jgi:energy-coupling factor transporter ATP-binding protein EcfA2
LNIDWTLNPDVNVLAGDNGSGKSTVLNLILLLLLKNIKFSSSFHLIDTIQIEFNHKKRISFTNVNGNPQVDIPPNSTKHLEYVPYSTNASFFISTGRFESLKGGVFDYGDNLIDKLHEQLAISYINTFDQELKDRESIQRLSNNYVRTELDWQIYHLQRDYSEYQLIVKNRTIDALKKHQETDEIEAKKNLFLDIIDELFSSTQKRIDRDKNEIAFIQRRKDELSPFHLSSGEKQILIILLIALVQDNKPAIMIMDEPEISLHTDWQESLIDNIRKLNENIQIIIATHSPSIIINGWKDKVFEMTDIIKK